MQRACQFLSITVQHTLPEIYIVDAELTRTCFFPCAQQMGLDKAVEEVKHRMSRYSVTVRASPFALILFPTLSAWNFARSSSRH